MSAMAIGNHEAIPAELAMRFLSLFPVEVMTKIVRAVDDNPTAQVRLDFKDRLLMGSDCTDFWRRKRQDVLK